MKRDEILNMPAGRIMDCEIQTKVFEKLVSVKESWRRDLTTKRPGARYRVVTFKSDGLDVPHYSTDIAAAWQVVEKLQTSKPHILVDIAQRSDDGTYEGLRWTAYLRVIGKNKNHFAAADTAPLAICRAALLAVMELA